MEIEFKKSLDGLRTKNNSLDIMVIGTISKEAAKAAFEDMRYSPKRIVSTNTRMYLEKDNTYKEAEVQFMFDKDKNLLDAAITPIYGVNTAENTYGIHVNARHYLSKSDVLDALKYYTEGRTA